MEYINGIGTRVYETTDYDQAMSFARFFDGNVTYTSTGYKVTI